MHCNEARQQLDSLGNAADTGSDLRDHLQKCDTCHNYAREKQLIWLLTDLPVREPRSGMEEKVLQRALGQAVSSPAGLHVRWALVTAASVVLAVVITLQFYPAGSGPTQARAIQAAVVEVQPQQTHMVNVLLTSPRVLEGAHISVQLDDNLVLEGYENVRNLKWRTSIKKGANKLSLPVQLQRGHSGRITVTVEHNGSSKSFSVDVTAKPGEHTQKLSMI